MMTYSDRVKALRAETLLYIYDRLDIGSDFYFDWFKAWKSANGKYYIQKLGYGAGIPNLLDSKWHELEFLCHMADEIFNETIKEDNV